MGVEKGGHLARPGAQFVGIGDKALVDRVDYAQLVADLLERTEDEQRSVPVPAPEDPDHLNVGSTGDPEHA